jgi:hypothetical protein
MRYDGVYSSSWKETLMIQSVYFILLEEGHVQCYNSLIVVEEVKRNEIK